VGLGCGYERRDRRNLKQVDRRRVEVEEDRVGGYRRAWTFINVVLRPAHLWLPTSTLDTSHND
jgi:hypothetical protein